MKRVLFLTLFLFFLFPSSIVFASNAYYNEENNFSLELDEVWFVYHNDYFKNLSPQDKANIITGFIHSDGKTEIMLKKYESSEKQFQLAEKLSILAQEENTKEKDFKRILNPIEVELGTKITRFTNVDSHTMTFLLKPNLNEMISYTWFLDENTLIEFISFGSSEVSIIERYSSPAVSDSTTIDIAKDEFISEITKKEDKKNKVDEWFALLVNEKLWIYALIGFISLFLVVKAINFIRKG